LPQDQGAAQTDPVFESSFDGTYIGNHALAPIGDGHFLPIIFLQAKLDCDVFGEAHVDRTSIHQGFHFDGLLFGIARIS